MVSVTIELLNPIEYFIKSRPPGGENYLDLYCLCLYFRRAENTWEAKPMKDEKESETIALDRGMHHEAVYHGCSQRTVAAIQDALGRHDDEVFKSACALDAGIAKYGDSTCGAYLASVMMFGVLFGCSQDNFSGGKEETNRVRRLTGLMREYFLAKYSSIDCKDVQTAILGRSYYIWDEEEKRSSKKRERTQPNVLRWSGGCRVCC
jgi:hypothetical protein